MGVVFGGSFIWRELYLAGVVFGGSCIWWELYLVGVVFGGSCIWWEFYLVGVVFGGIFIWWELCLAGVLFGVSCLRRNLAGNYYWWLALVLNYGVWMHKVALLVGGRY